jgi:hypothetical protein
VAVTIGNYAALPSDGSIAFLFDLYSNHDGDEASAVYDGTLHFYRWSPTALDYWPKRPTTDMSVSDRNGVVTVTLPTDALDDVTGLGVRTEAWKMQLAGAEGNGFDMFAEDLAPDDGYVHYESPGPTTAADPEGDRVAAPDIQEVAVSDAKDGSITFAVSTPSHAVLSAADSLSLTFDVDPRRRGRSLWQPEAFIDISSYGVFAERWNPRSKRFEHVQPRVTVRNTAGVLRVVVPRRFLYDFGVFSFQLTTFERGPSEGSGGGALFGAQDTAPADPFDFWRYELVNMAPLRLIMGNPRSVPAQPLAGKRLTITVPTLSTHTGRNIASGSVTCAIRVGGAGVPATGHIARGIGGRCSTVMPQSATGKQVRGSMTVRSGGRSVTRRFTLSIS